MRYIVMTIFFNALSIMNVISTRYCPDMRPQSYVTIEQLLGMWFGVELINHKQNQDRLGSQYKSSCPVIHISEDHTPTIPPFYRENAQNPYGTNYGIYRDGKHHQRNDYDTNRGSYTTEPYQTTYDYDFEYGRTIYRQPSYQGPKYRLGEYPRRYEEDIKRLRLLWTDSGNQVEYTLKYNTSTPGLWVSPAYKNVLESPLKTQPNQFSGNVQVIKAVGNHLVLIFCHELPDQQLYTVVLSRKPNLTRQELNDVHDLLKRRDLEINNITEVCAENSALKLHINIFLVIYVISINIGRIFKYFSGRNLLL